VFNFNYYLFLTFEHRGFAMDIAYSLNRDVDWKGKSSLQGAWYTRIMTLTFWPFYLSLTPAKPSIYLSIYLYINIYFVQYTFTRIYTYLRDVGIAVRRRSRKDY